MCLSLQTWVTSLSLIFFYHALSTNFMMSFFFNSWVIYTVYVHHISLSIYSLESIYIFVLLRVTLAMVKHQDQNQLIEEKVYFAYISWIAVLWGKPRPWGKQVGTQKQEQMQRPRWSAVYWLVPHGLLILIYYRTQDHHLRSVLTHNGLSPSP